MAKKTSKPQALKAFLSLMLVIVVLGGAALFYFGLNIVNDYVVEVNHRTLDADASAKQIEQLQLLRGELSQSESLVNKANRFFATPSNYQSQTLNDLRNYANKVGLSIDSTKFNDPTEEGEYSVTLKLKSPVNYQSLVRFLELVEGNLPKMQVVALSLKHQAGGSANDINVGDIKINLSVR